MASDALVELFGAAVAPLNLIPQRLAGSLHEASRQKALETFEPGSPEFETLELETILWDLVLRLKTTETADSSSLNTLVIKWVQENLTLPSEPTNLQSIKWMYTRNQANKRVAGTTVISELDLDAPLRQGRPIAEEDRVRDEALFKYVFKLLIAGQIDTAKMACADTNNWLIHAALNATQAASSHGLLIDACRTLSAAPASQISVYEAGIYGLLSGNLSALVPLCESWETLLVAHLVSGASLEEFERNVSQDHKIALQGSDWRRKVALALIQNRFTDLVAQLVAEIRDLSKMPTSALVQNPWLIRILLHIQLVLQEQADPTLIQIYVEYLCEDPALLASRLFLVPEYVRFLSGDEQAKTFGRVLAQITDKSTQLRLIELAQNYEISLGSAIEWAVQLNFELYTENTEQGSHTDTTADERLVAILQWPVAAEQWLVAAKSLLHAYVLLFKNNRRSGINLLTLHISAEYVRTRAMDVIRSRIHEYPDVVADLAMLRQYALLGDAVASIAAWTNADHDVPGWRSTAPKLLGNVIDAVNLALQFAVPSSSAISSASRENMLVARKDYLPRIIYDLLDVLREAQPVSIGYARIALDFAVKIADEKLKLYELFDEKLLKSLAEPALALQ